MKAMSAAAAGAAGAAGASALLEIISRQTPLSRQTTAWLSLPKSAGTSLRRAAEPTRWPKWICAVEKNVIVDREVRGVAETGYGELTEKPRPDVWPRLRIHRPRWRVKRNSPRPKLTILFLRRRTFQFLIKKRRRSSQWQPTRRSSRPGNRRPTPNQSSIRLEWLRATSHLNSGICSVRVRAAAASP